MATTEIFNSPILSVLIFTFVLFLILFFMEGEAAPHRMVFTTIKGIIVEKGFALTLLAMFAVLAVNFIELHVEKYVIVPNLLTKYLSSNETGILTALQEIQSYPLTFLLTYVYVYGFPAFVAATLIYYYHHDRKVSLKNLCYTYILTYLAALPFYLLVPVTEAWAYNQNITLLIEQVYPAYNQGFRNFSGIDNNFPSLHTAISVALALISLKHGNKRLIAVSLTTCGLILFSTLYLGIHWIFDVIAGIILALITVYLGAKLGTNSLLANKFKKTLISLKLIDPPCERSTNDV